MSETPVGPPMHTEGTAPGAELHNYVTKSVSEDGTYVTITRHSETIELIPQPLTPEEIAQQKKSERIALGVVGGIAVLFLGFTGFVAYLDDKNNRGRRTDELEAEPSA